MLNKGLEGETEMKDYSDDYKNLEENKKRLFENCQETGKSFMSVHKATIVDKALTAKEKELIALGIAVAIRCEGCILSHVAAAIKHGATMEEIAETIDVTIMMGGGPSTVYGGKALEVAEQLLK